MVEEKSGCPISRVRCEKWAAGQLAAEEVDFTRAAPECRPEASCGLSAQTEYLGEKKVRSTRKSPLLATNARNGAPNLFMMPKKWATRQERILRGRADQASHVVVGELFEKS